MIAEETLQAYMRQWGATSVPFCERAAGEDAFFATPQSGRASELLNQSAALRNLMLLTGDNGVGKSALLGRWMRKLDTRLYYPIAVTQATLTGTALLAFFAEKLGKSARLSRSHNLRQIEEALAELGKATAVLIMDEAQNYDQSALEEIRLLLGLNLGEVPAFALILAGDQYLPKALQLRSHRSLYTRIAVHYRLGALARREIEAYVEHGFRSAAITRQAVEPAAMELLAGASEGIPRIINLIVRRAWIEASAQKASTIGADHMQCALELVPVALEKAS
jgi:type II secretory pathway predicted ATPase ExeA